jgi:hypothetical protein
VRSRKYVPGDPLAPAPGTVDLSPGVIRESSAFLLCNGREGALRKLGGRQGLLSPVAKGLNVSSALLPPRLFRLTQNRLSQVCLALF